jgi:hypothetical protein
MWAVVFAACGITLSPPSLFIFIFSSFHTHQRRGAGLVCMVQGILNITTYGWLQVKCRCPIPDTDDVVL